MDTAKHRPVPLPAYLASVGARVRKKRERRGWSQKRLAWSAGLKPSAVSMLESGRRAPTLRVLYRVAQALGCDVGALTKGSRRRPFLGGVVEAKVMTVEELREKYR